MAAVSKAIAFLSSITIALDANPAAPVYATITDQHGTIVWRVALRQAGTYHHRFHNDQNKLQLVADVPDILGVVATISTEPIGWGLK